MGVSFLGNFQEFLEEKFDKRRREMLFDYRYWLRRFLDWLLDDEEDSEKMVTKGLIGEAPFLLSVYLRTCVITAEI